MRLEHEVIYLLENGEIYVSDSSDSQNIEQFIEEEILNDFHEKWIFLKEGKNIREALIAQAISLDIRGDYGLFLKFQRDENDEFLWYGNQFEIITNKKCVKLTNLLSDDHFDDNISTTVALDDWYEVLNDWKSFYLNELGFMEFDTLEKSHLFGVLIMLNNKLSIQSDLNNKLITESINDCALRYGVAVQTIYSQCKHAIGVTNIHMFYHWVNDLFNNTKNPITHIVKEWRPKKYNYSAQQIFRKYLYLDI